MFIDDSEQTGTTTRARVILEESDAPSVSTSEIGDFVVMSLWDGMGDWSEVVSMGDGVYEVICS